ncbi:MAG: shikimate kinase [Rhizobiales bacterium]|nr:shikimate kinase [Hyphomicrobiales bacterium]MDQ3558515.1 shikimate kinase [Pseudomonadota bacterium]
MEARQAIAEEAPVDRVLSRLGDRCIVLIGMMGAGKTSIGRRLATVLHLPFVDADVEIERAANLSIPEIFSHYGEAHFREGERRVVARLLSSGPAVLATGGGAFICEETRARCREHGVTVWLKADVSVLLERVRKKGNRPLLEKPDPDGVMRRLLAEREPVYALADIAVASREGPHHALVGEIIAALDAHLAKEPALAG